MSSELRSLWVHAGGQLPVDWHIVSLESLLRDTKSIAVGVMYPGPDTPGGTPLVKVGDIKGGIIAAKPIYCISAETNQEHKRTQLKGDELLMTLVGNPGECVVVKSEMVGWNPARAIAVIRLRDTEMRPYLKAVLQSAAGKHLIDAVLNTTVQKTLNLKDIRKLPIPLPPTATIKGISTFLEALTDRIALLRDTNATLEAIAQALFKSWFVDFDPVHAKQGGRAPEGMDDATAALFPDSFEESEMGLVPKGWTVEALDSIADYLNGLALQKFPPEEDSWLPVIKIAQLRKGDTIGADLSNRNMKSEYIIQNGTVLFSWSGSLAVEIGAVAKVR
ncbi:MAG: restriction endonuclease subunit S [Burkholderiaceae bacterium]